MMIMMMIIKVLRWSLLLQQCDQPAAAAACVVIICVSEVAASVWHTLQRPISCLRDTGGKGREGKGSREGKRRAGFSGLSSVDNLVRRFTRCQRQTTPVLSPDARSSIRVSSSSSSIPASPSTVSRDQSFFFHLFHFENLAELNPNFFIIKRSKISRIYTRKTYYYHPHGCHWKGTTILWWDACYYYLGFALLVTIN